MLFPGVILGIILRDFWGAFLRDEVVTTHFLAANAPFNQGTSAGVHPDSAFQGALIQG
ncbi:MAG TPA: hypothetical protein VK673_00725 [Chthoniobacterales bacterium]|jgi:hypothetical protein|nr:hypothetical protein [Chthoniobacterales bacterium]